MDECIEAIRAALARDATHDVRVAGARACGIVCDALRRATPILPGDSREVGEMLAVAFLALKVELLSEVAKVLVGRRRP